MTNKEIKQILREKDVAGLYHANSVATACTFLENGGLLSRGAVEERGLFQTPQQSDATDKELDVFEDIFFDSVDIHKRAKQLNHYGPVTFVYSIDLIDSLPEGSIKITRDNPMYWNGNMAENEKYFLSERELREGFVKGAFAQHITVRHQREPISFQYLEKIMLEDPGVEDKSYFEKAHKRLQRLVEACGLDAPLEVRECPPDCKCQETYRSRQAGYIYYRFHV